MVCIRVRVRGRHFVEAWDSLFRRPLPRKIPCVTPTHNMEMVCRVIVKTVQQWQFTYGMRCFLFVLHFLLTASMHHCTGFTLNLFSGTSVTAGHDSLYEHSYPFVFNTTMARLFAAAGVGWVSPTFITMALHCSVAFLGMAVVLACE